MRGFGVHFEGHGKPLRFIKTSRTHTFIDWRDPALLVKGRGYRGGSTPHTGSTAGLEVGGTVALHVEVTGGGGVPSVCLPTAVGVGTGALGHGEHQLALLRLTGGEHGNLHGLACSVEVGGDGGEVVDGGGHVLGLVDVAIVETNGGKGKALRQGAFQNGRGQ
jgi:hypothetical protein